MADRNRNRAGTKPVEQGIPPRHPIELSENARIVLEKRYLRRGTDGKPCETIEEMFWRVAWHVAEPQTRYGGNRQAMAEQYYNLLTQKRFFPNSPTFTGAGTPLGQLAACFVLPIDDDMGRTPDGIFQTLRNAALIQQTGGGNGFSFSRLRPKGARVSSSNGEATGPVGFLRVYDQAFEEISQGGARRGANMAVLRVDHPDIRRFITCKVSEDQITNFNISVGVTDAFMRAVEEDGTIDLIAPHDGSVWETVRAREIFDLIVKHAHHNGEPGMLFLDTANRDNPVPHLYTLEATNPCLVGETRIATEFGLVRIADLAQAGIAAFVAADNRAPLDEAQRPAAQCGVALRPASPAWMTRRRAPVMRLTTRGGFSVTATLDHLFLTENGYVALKDLRPGDRILLQSGEGAWSRVYDLPNREALRERIAQMALSGSCAAGALIQHHDLRDQHERLPQRWSHALGLVLGWLVGDGWLSENGSSPVGMAFSKESMLEVVHETLSDWFGPGCVHQRGGLKQLIYGRLPYEFFRSLGVLPVRAPHKRVPEAIWTAPREAVVGFLQGLFSAGGTVHLNGPNDGCTICLTSSSLDLLRDVQVLLANFGIIGRIYTRRRASSKITPDGEGGHRPSRHQPRYELILAQANCDRFAELIGFADDEKQALVEAHLAARQKTPPPEHFSDPVLSVEDAGVADVYDLSQPQTHSLIANAAIVHNCGEQWLGPYENCCLGSVNLAQHVTADGRVDWDKLRQTVELSTRFLDDVVDANKYVPAVPQLEVAAHRVRRIGLGIMGLADLMYRLGVRYGSKEGQEFAAQVMEFVHYHCMRTSIELAKERGAFPAIRGSIFDPAALKWQPPTPLFPYERDWGRPPLDWQAITEGIKAHGIRNGAHTTIAPTGTISTVAGVEGYGCEPVFALAYVRYFDDNGVRRALQYTSPLFEQALKEAGLDEPTRRRIVEQVNITGSCQDVPEVPEAIRRVFVVAADISAEEHVYMQAALQRFVSNSISKTCNFPPTATEEDVAKAFMLAWKLGCKGLTVYVAGTREKVVLETAAIAQARAKSEAPPSAQPPAPTPPVQPTPRPPEAKGLPHPPAGPENSAKVISPGLLPLFAQEPKKPRARVLPGYTYRIPTPLGTTFVTINENGDNEPFEVFIHTSKAGSETAAVSEALGRLISYVLRLNSPVPPHERLKEVIHQLEGIGGGRSLGLGPNRVRSLPDGVAQVLAEYYEEHHGTGGAIRTSEAKPEDELLAPAPGQMPLQFGDLCPECGEAAVVNEEGCRKCYACGYSEC